MYSVYMFLVLTDLNYFVCRIKQDEIRPYFPLPVVLDGIFALCRDLFGITIKQSDGKAPIWHKDVQFFNIFDENGKEISGFYLDPYLRPEDKDGTPRCELGQSTLYAF